MPHRADDNGDERFVRRVPIPVLAASGAIILACAKVLFSAGGDTARTQEQIATLNQRFSEAEQAYARKDVLEQELKDMKEQEAKIERNLDAQQKTLSDILIKVSRR